MAIDVGDPVPLSIFITDDNGNAANAGAVVLTITLPDGTPATPAITNPATGTYTVSPAFYTTQSGRHDVAWVATGANACDYNDTFFVQPAHSLIISLAEARAALGTATANTVKDEDLRSFISACTPTMEDICGPILSTTRTETYDGGGTQIALNYAPVVSVTTVIESYGSNYAKTLTLQNRFAGGGSDAYGYDIDLATGIITRLAAGVAVHFPSGQRNIQIVYIAGRAVITPNIILATRRLVKHLFQSEQQDYNPPQFGPESLTHTPSGFTVPSEVIMLCANSKRLPGVA
jgi:hypothetical protein